MILKSIRILSAVTFVLGAMSLNAAVPAMSLEYFYDKDGTIIGRSVNGEKFTYSYDKKGQLLSVKSLDGKVAETYAYDPAGNILSKTIDGRTTYFKYDKANQLVSSTDYKGKVMNYEYDAAGRLVKEGDKEYKYSYLDKIVTVTEQSSIVATFDYYVDGQVASATQGGMTESFVWDGLALVARNTTTYVNEPAVTGGNPILANNKVLFNDMLGSTLGINDGNRMTQVAMTSFGETSNNEAFFTGKPMIGELGYAFLFRNYRADNGKWQTADPMGYPDGWNQLTYCRNGVAENIDLLGAITFKAGTPTSKTSSLPSYYNTVVPTSADRGTYTSASINANAIAIQYPVASEMALHYLDNSGTDYQYSANLIASIFSTSISTFTADAVAFLSSCISTGSSINNLKFYSDWTSTTASSGDPSLSLGGFDYCVAGVSREKTNGLVEVIMSIYIYDYYDFHATGLFAGIGLKDDDWLRLAVVGLAKPFNTHGRYNYDFVIE